MIDECVSINSTTHSHSYVSINNELLKKRVCDMQSVDYDIGYENLINRICSQIGVTNENEIFTRLINESIPLDFLRYLTDESYRDHYVHQFNVASLGDYLLSINVTDSSTLLDEICGISSLWDSETFLEAWWITSLLHDHAYPIEFLIKFAHRIPKLRRRYPTKATIIDQMKDLFREVNRLIFSSKFNTIINDLFEGNNENIVEGIFPLLENELEILSLPETLADELSGHHIIGGLNLIWWLREANQCFIEDNSINQSVCRAIFLHHKSVPIRLSDDPLSFLLKLCDTLQEWGRPKIIKNRYVCESSNIYLGPFRKNGDSLRFRDQLNVIFEYENYDLLKESTWNYGYFIESKQKELGELDFSEIFKDFEIKYEIHTKHSLKK